MAYDRHMIKRPASGFTIVELLVVIVVIGILAAITIVSFSGVRNRAENAQIVAMVRQYTQALAAYTTTNDAYPPVPSQATPGADDRICLGVGYEDTDSDTIPDCGNSDYPSIEYAPFNNAMRTLVTLPSVNTNSLPTPYQTSQFTGATFIREDAFTVDGQPNPYYLMYVLNGGNADCGTPVVEEIGGSQPFPEMTPSSNDWSWSDGSTTMCVVALPNV